jgi:predicted alpha/beta superfamily hydrolase
VKQPAARTVLAAAVALAPAFAPAACRSRTAGHGPPSDEQREIVDHTEVHVLPPAPGGRQYRISVAVPDSYGTHPERRYPVVYITDGYWDFKLLKSIIGGLVYDKAIPESILVGIGYPGEAPDYDRLRRWDLTPVPDTRAGATERGETGHAAAFLETIEHQMIPFVEGRYRVDPSQRVLGGSSLGGLFVLYALFAKPALFSAYIAPSPAVSYADGWLFSHEEAFARSRKPLAARLYMTAAEKEDPAYVASIEKLGARLRARAYLDLTYELRIVEGERHAGTKPESFNRGVRFAFARAVAAAAAAAAGDDGNPCRQLLRTLCALRRAPCAELEAAIWKPAVTDEGCRIGNEALRGIDRLPPAVQAATAARVLADVTGAERLRQALRDTLLPLSVVEHDLRKGRPPRDHSLKEILAIGPPACSGVLGRYRETSDAKLRAVLRRLLVDLRGQDLGAGHDAWKPWCDGVVRALVITP